MTVAQVTWHILLHMTCWLLDARKKSRSTVLREDSRTGTTKAVCRKKAESCCKTMALDWMGF